MEEIALTFIASKELLKMWVYVDGACSANGKPWAKGGYGVWFGSNHHLNCSGTFYGRQTNQVAEIHAAIVAIEIATDEQADSLRIHPDSMYLINGATSWLEKWSRNNWLTCRGEPVVSKDKWIELHEAMNRFDGNCRKCGTYGHKASNCRKVRTNPVKTHKPSPIFQPKCRAAVKSMGIPKTAISKSEKLFGADFY